MRLLSTFCLILLLASMAWAGKADGKLDIVWVDTEGGGATLLVTPAGESVLIDSGNPGKPGGPPRDPTRIFKAAEAASLKKIDILLTTHYHIDHFGGAAELATLIPIGTVYDNGEFVGGRERPSKEYLGFKADKRVKINPGDKLPLKNVEDPKAPQLSVRCLCARTETVPPPAGAKPTAGERPRRKLDDYSDNANSVVVLIQFGDFRMYAGGDVTWNIEEKLAWPNNLVGQVDIYQVTHHGLDVSNNPALVKACQPTVAVFCNGPTKGCMPEPMATMKSIDSIVGIYQMHRNMRPNEDKVNVPDEFIANNGGKEDLATPIRCAVSADAKNFAISIASTKHEQSYAVKPK